MGRTMEDTPQLPYTEHHFADVKDVGIAFEAGRVWVCLNGCAVLRAKVMPDGKLSVLYDSKDYEFLYSGGSLESKDQG